jgi:predicted nucleotide-binding protein (sugar kinase/HSP70/actin superfamily)
MRLIGQAHTMLHRKGIMRIQTDIRVGSRYVHGHIMITKAPLAVYYPSLLWNHLNAVMEANHADWLLPELTRSRHSVRR